MEIKPGPSGRLLVRFRYDPDVIAKLKAIPGHRWHPAEKHWSVPDEPEVRQRLEALRGASKAAEPAAPAPAPPVSGGVVARVREAARARHLSPRTEQAYVGWIQRFILSAGAKPENWNAVELGRFLSSLATDGHVAAATQNQALHAVLFLIKDAFGGEIGFVNGVVRAKKPERLPVVLSKDEVVAILKRMDGTPRLMATLLYGAGLRLLECCQLRVKDIDFSRGQIVVRSGKGNKDRATMLPAAAREPLAAHLEKVRAQHADDLAKGLGRVVLPNALDRKYPCSVSA